MAGEVKRFKRVLHVREVEREITQGELAEHMREESNILQRLDVIQTERDRALDDFCSGRDAVISPQQMWFERQNIDVIERTLDSGVVQAADRGDESRSRREAPKRPVDGKTRGKTRGSRQPADVGRGAEKSRRYYVHAFPEEQKGGISGMSVPGGPSVPVANISRVLGRIREIEAKVYPRKIEPDEPVERFQKVLDVARDETSERKELPVAEALGQTRTATQKSAAVPSKLEERLALWEDAIQELSAEYEVDPDLVRAVMRCESGGNPDAVSSAGAIGLMQLMPATARGLVCG